MILRALIAIIAASLSLGAARAASQDANRAGWWDYQIIMWQAQTPRQWRTLKSIGVTAGMTFRPGHEDSRLRIDALNEAGLRWYVENIATDFYSAYHRYRPNLPNTAAFIAAKAAHRADPQNLDAFKREPSLSDPAWQARIAARLRETVTAYARQHPLYYSLGDETGIADLSAAWDFDFSEVSLAGFRDWLRTQYPSLHALNRQWGTHFDAWQNVMPETTTQAMQREEENYSAWSDFKAWMDVAFARALRLGTDAVHSADPTALAAIEGVQMPGWGGYDYAQIAPAVDLMEIYNMADDVALARAMNPALIEIGTSFHGGPDEMLSIWRNALRQERGLILWDEHANIANPDGTLGPRGEEFADMFRELRGGLGALLINSRRIEDPIAILYSPASFRAQWMLDNRSAGEKWTRRSADTENGANAVRDATADFIKLVRARGLSATYLSAAMVESGALHEGHIKLLLVPHAIAMSRKEAHEIRRFVTAGGVVLADALPGQFDEHLRKRAVPLLGDLFHPRKRPGRAILNGVEPDANFVQACMAANIAPAFALTDSRGARTRDIETYVYRNGDVTLVAIIPASWAKPSALGSLDQPLTLELTRSANVYDVRAREALGEKRRITFHLDGFEPRVFALSSAPLAAPKVTLLPSLRLGETGEIALARGDDAQLDTSIYHIDVLNPAGHIEPTYSGNVLAPKGSAMKLLSIPRGAPAGAWRMRVTDLIGGASTTASLNVTAN